jgi:hypothetical protein
MTNDTDEQYRENIKRHWGLPASGKLDLSKYTYSMDGETGKPMTTEEMLALAKAWGLPE